MKIKLQNLTRFALTASLCILSCAAWATPSAFIEDFSDHTPAPFMATGTGYSSPTVDYTDQFSITSGTGSRIYLGTVGTDYNTIDFVFEADVTIPDSSDPWAISFFGMGSADATGSYGEPVSPNVLMALRNDALRIESRLMGASNTEIDNVSAIPNGTHRLKMEWTASTQEAQFSLDLGLDGSFEHTFSITVTGVFFDGSNAQLILGGGNGLTFDNIAIYNPSDADSDGLPNAYELLHTSPPSTTSLNPGDDLDTDGLTNLEEFSLGTIPTNPDSDGDSLNDGDELVGVGQRPITDPSEADSDGDGLNDGSESNTGIFVDATNTGTDPTRSDTDSDGVSDSEEIADGADPLRAPWNLTTVTAQSDPNGLLLTWNSLPGKAYNIQQHSVLNDDKLLDWDLVQGAAKITSPTNSWTVPTSDSKQFFVVWEFPEPKELHVALSGDDNNDGSIGNEFRTISAAAAVASPGDVITVHAGVYREQVAPPRGGASDALRIVFQAAPGDLVEIKGSEIITNWVETAQSGLWQAVIPNSFFGAYNPYSTLIAGDYLHTNDENQHTGMVYLNGTSLEEAMDETELLTSGTPARWFGEVNTSNTILRAWFNGQNPNTETVEINVRRAVFYPERENVDYITVRGFTLSQAAPNWAPPTAEQVGLIGTHWSKGWIIEDNTITQSRCTAVTLGKYGDQYDNTYQHNSQAFTSCIDRALDHGWTRERIGHHIVRNNTISDCGQAGIVGSMGCAFSTISNNVIHTIAQNQRFAGYETSGVKFHAPIDVVIKDNHIYECGGFGGMWLDWMTQGTRVTGNLFHNNSRDLFVEVNHGPFTVDHNIFLSGEGLLESSGGGAYAHNLFGSRITLRSETRTTPYHEPHSTALAGEEGIVGDDERFINNLFLGSTGLAPYDSWQADKLKAEGNVYTDGAAPSGYDVRSVDAGTFNAGLTFTEEADGWWIEYQVDPTWLTGTSREIVTTSLLGNAFVSGAPFENPDESPLYINTDYFGGTRDINNPAPGPFKPQASNTVRLKVWPKQ